MGMLEKDDDSDDHQSRERGLPTLSSPPACMLLSLPRPSEGRRSEARERGADIAGAGGGKRRRRGHSLTLAEGY